LVDPIRAAEEILVVDNLSNGRVDVITVMGYVRHEFEMFGESFAGRARLYEERLETLCAAVTGETFRSRDRPVTVTPAPVQRPRPAILVGGAVPAAARRAARLGDGFAPAVDEPDLYDLYLSERRRLGKPPGRLLRMGGPLFVHVSDDPDRDWEQIAPHALHDMNSYARWAAEANANTGFRPVADRHALRQTGVYAVVTPHECVALGRRLGPDRTLYLHPLMGGLAPDLGWASLEFFTTQVLPELQGDERHPESDPQPSSTSAGP
jgi:alkanesulfonate monooxygenase SsuD/methylene tetrahydromethanopterin reductase-like flavin-dependent oxidoreductase (luciferase family)